MNVLAPITSRCTTSLPRRLRHSRVQNERSPGRGVLLCAGPLLLPGLCPPGDPLLWLSDHNLLSPLPGSVQAITWSVRANLAPAHTAGCQRMSPQFARCTPMLDAVLHRQCQLECGNRSHCDFLSLMLQWRSCEALLLSRAQSSVCTQLGAWCREAWGWRSQDRPVPGHHGRSQHQRQRQSRPRRSCRRQAVPSDCVCTAPNT